MFWWLCCSMQRTMRVNHTLILRQGPAVEGPAIQSGLPRGYPLEFARTTDGYIYMASGLGPVTKWDGLAPQVKLSGVEAPITAPVLSFTGSGGSITGTYQAYVRFLDGDGNVSNLSPVSNTATATNNTTAVYSNVAVPESDNVVIRQILRNTAGQALTFYVDIETTNLFETDFTSALTDSELRLREPVALFDPELILNIANFHDPPPDDKPIISFYQNRLWLYGVVDYSVGHAHVITGSTTVTLIGADVNETMEGRLLYIDGADRYYLIEEVDEAAQTLTLGDAYRGITDKWASYTITPDANRRHLLCYSEPGEFDSWRESQNIVVASSDDIDDEGTGLISTQSFLFIVQRRHIYRLTFFQDPIIDGGIFLSARRGCVNNRCWVTVDGFVYLLDDRGIYRFDGSEAVEEISQPIQDLFYFDRPEGELRLNWSSSKFWSASHDRNDSTIRWFVAFSGMRYPRHAICFNYSVPQWWIEEMQWPMGDSCLLKQANPIPVVTSSADRVFAIGVGTLDHLDVDSGDTLMTATSAGVRSITAPTTATLPASLVGTPIGIVAGRGKRQIRTIVSVSGRTINVDRPWDVKPDDTSQFRLGAIPYSWRSNWMRWTPGETDQTRRVVLSYDPMPEETDMDLRVFYDYGDEPRDWSLTWPINVNAGSGLMTVKGDPDAVVDLTQEKGYSYLQLDAMREYGEWRKDVISFEIRGYSGNEAIRIHAIDVEGAG